MENDPFNTSKPESDSSTESDSDLSSKKKKKFRKLPILPGNQETSTESSEAKPKILEASESLWKRLVGSPTEEKSAEPSAETENETELAGDQPEVPTDVEVSMEELSQDEQAEIAEHYIEARLEQIEYEQANPAESPESDPAEQAADVALLTAIRNGLKFDHESSITEHVEEAYAQTTKMLAPDSAVYKQPPESKPALTFEPARAPKDAGSEAAPYAAWQPEGQAPAKVPEKPTSDIYENHTGTALLVGGAVGYLVGRRRGRINTEKELNTLEKRMTVKVEAIERIIIGKEQQIREMVREKIPASTVRSKEAALKPSIPAKEMLGVVSLKAIEAIEATPPKQVVKPEKFASKKPTPEKIVSIQTMSRAEVLELSENIQVGSTNLRRVYETNLIGERSLRRLIEAKGRGGDIRAMLEREMVEKEMSYERDPRLRNSGAMGTLAAGAAVKVLNDSGMASSVKKQVDADQKKSKSATASSSHDGSRSNQPIAAYITVLTLSVVIIALLYLLFTSN